MPIKLRIAIPISVRRGMSGGVRKHLQEVVPRWCHSNWVEQVVLFVPDGILENLETLGVQVIRVPVRNYWCANRGIGHIAANGRFNVAFETAARKVQWPGVPVVTLIQNVEPIQRPAYAMSMAWRLRLWTLRVQQRRACREATRIVAVSQYTREALETCFGVGGKTDVVYHGYDPSEAHNASRPAFGFADEPFIFSAGSLVPYRGYEDLFRAVALLRKQGRSIPLVIVAGAGGGLAGSYERWIKAFPKSLGVADRVVWMGQLSRREMAWCYLKAQLFVQTSRAESFSNVQVEALGAGCRIVSCMQAPMPEILGEAAVYYQTGNALALATKIAGALDTDEKAATLEKARALQRARVFSWDTTASQTLMVLRRAVGEYGRGC